MTYQERWIITAKLLGYKIVKDDADGERVVCPSGRVIYCHPTVLTHIAVVQDIDKMFGLKWDTQPYLNAKNTGA